MDYQWQDAHWAWMRRMYCSLLLWITAYCMIQYCFILHQFLIFAWATRHRRRMRLVWHLLEKNGIPQSYFLYPSFSSQFYNKPQLTLNASILCTTVWRLLIWECNKSLDIDDVWHLWRMMSIRSFGKFFEKLSYPHSPLFYHISVHAIYLSRFRLSAKSKPDGALCAEIWIPLVLIFSARSDATFGLHSLINETPVYDPEIFSSQLGFTSVSILSSVGFFLRSSSRWRWRYYLQGAKPWFFPSPFFLPCSHPRTCFLCPTLISSTASPMIPCPFGEPYCPSASCFFPCRFVRYRVGGPRVWTSNGKLGRWYSRRKDSMLAEINFQAASWPTNLR